MIMRVAFTLINGTEWAGGYNYLLNLVRVLRQYAHDRVEPVLFAGYDVEEKSLEPFSYILNNAVIQDPVFDTAHNAKRSLLRLLLGTEQTIESVFKKHSIDVVFEPAIYYGWRFPFSTLAWIPDFQHRLLPEMFSRAAYWKRDLGLRIQMFTGRVIMLSSESAKQDMKRFYGKAGKNAFVVPFAVETSIYTDDVDPGLVRSRYGLPKTFFYLPNQFWKHKNHQVIVEALKILKDQGESVVVAASGNSRDHKHPGYFESLQNKISNYEIEQNFRYLGVVPYKELIGLMKASIAVINPSFIEGWSTTVEEAKSLGIPLILSDIPVHREQTREAMFFDPGSAHSLAETMLVAISSFDLQLRTELQQQAAAKTRYRLKAFADKFVEALSFTVQQAV
jgi:glycosyltransferase involved in cell wall biosynthesis